MEKHYEMLWDCQYCGTTKLLGKTHRFCVNCGAPQNPDSRYFPSDSEKVAVEDHVFVGVDVSCPSCGQLNAGGTHFCQQCGSPLEGGKQAATLGSQTRADGETFESSGSRDIVKEKAMAQEKPKRQEGGLNRSRLLIIAGVIALIVGAIWFFTRTETVTVLVSGHEWERNIYIDKYERFSVDSWWDVRPSGDNAVMGSCRQQQRSTRQIPDGESCSTVRTDRGDGTFSESRVCTTKYRSEPVYDRMCTWQVSDWRFDRNARTTGGLDDTPTWASVSLSCENQRSLGCQRESSRTEFYNLLLQATIEGEKYTYKCPLPEQEWRDTRIETAFNLDIVVVNKADGKCDTLKRVGS